MKFLADYGLSFGVTGRWNLVRHQPILGELELPEKYDSLSSVQKGSIGEHALATAFVLTSGGRLSVYMPLTDDHGIDLIVYDKNSGRMLPVQVKSRNWLGVKRGHTQFNVGKKTFDKRGGSVFVGVLVDPKTATIEMSWLIPMNRLPGVSRENENNYIVRPSIRSETKDKFRKFRHDNLKSLIQAVYQSIKAK